MPGRPNGIGSAVSASRRVIASAATVFELIADPSLQPQWDGNDNLSSSDRGHRVRAVGDVFVTSLTNGNVRENHVVEFIEGRRIAWCPADPGRPPAGHLWRWTLAAETATTTIVTHSYDWTHLTDPRRFERARGTTPDHLDSSIRRLAALATQT